MKILNEYIPDLNWIHKSKQTLQKAKIYLKPQERPPKGLEVKRGPKGGLYYESKAKVAPKIVPKAKTQKITSFEDAKQLFEQFKDSIFFDSVASFMHSHVVFSKNNVPTAAVKDKLHHNTWVIETLEVNPKFKRHGFGIAIMANSIIRALQSGATNISLIEWGDEAHHFYDAIGMSQHPSAESVRIGDKKWMLDFIAKTQQKIQKDINLIEALKYDPIAIPSKKAKHPILKAKIYLKPQERPPKGLEVKRGPKGGLYYETKVKIAPSKPKETRALGIESKYEEESKKLFEDEEEFFDDNDYYPSDKIYKTDFDKQILTELENWSSFIENTDKKRLIKLFEDYQKGVLSPEEHQSLSRIITINQKLLEHEVGETITVYRGLKTKHYPTIDKHAKITSHGLSSWSLDADTAKKFVYGLIHDGDDAILLKTKIPVKSIGITYLSGWSEFPEEQEIMILPNIKMDVRKIKCE